MHIKAEGMTQFDIFHVFVENSLNSELCFFWALLKPTKIWNLSQKPYVWAALKTSSSELKKMFGPSIIKAHDPNNQPPSSPGV